MAKTDLSVSALSERLSYNPDTGFLVWAGRPRSGVTIGMRAGSVCNEGYIRLRFGTRRLYAHCVAWALTYGTWPNGEIDHINGIRSDNRLCNLRDVCTSLNQQNRRDALVTSNSGLLGAQWNSSRQEWRASIFVNGRYKWLGSFETAQAAHEAYMAAKRKLHPGFVDQRPTMAS